MQRITVSIDDPLSDTLDQMATERGYGSRSEAVRDLVRDGIERWRAEHPDGGHCVANLSYIVDRRVRSLPQRLSDMQHAAHDLVATSMTVRLDHYHGMESVILKGTTEAVRAFADRIRAEKGVRFGALNMLRVTPDDAHDSAEDHSHRGHHHLLPGA